MTVQTFVTIHDQELVDRCEVEQRFAGLDYEYLFVGPRPMNPDDFDRPIIVCRDWSDNIEHWPQFYDFTGWWVLAHHDLIRTRHVMFLQYDMRPAVPDLEQRVTAALDGADMAAFVAGHRSAQNWMLMLSGFAELFAGGLSLRGVSPPPPDFEEWPSTQGTAWRHAAFYQFMQWVRPMLDVWALSVWAGHLAERSVYAWLRHTGRSWSNLANLVDHEHGDCHGTCSRMAGDLATADVKAATFGQIV